MIEITIITEEGEQKFPIQKTPIVIGRNPNPEYPHLVLLDPFVSRSHVQITETSGGLVRVECLGSNPIVSRCGETIRRGKDALLSLPAEIRIGRSVARVAAVGTGVTFLHTPTEQPLAIGPTNVASRFAIDDAVAPDRLIGWFENLIALQASATGIDGLYRQAAKAVVELIGLDRCVVLIRSEEDWTVQFEHGQHRTDEIVFSHSVVDHVVRSGQTVFDSSLPLSAVNSLTGICAFVGSPIKDAQSEIIACLFGARRLAEDSPSPGVLPIEAQLVQVIAGIVSMRISRWAAEADQVRTQVQLEQFAPPALVREMQSNPHWLDANQRELTLMFGDIRGFSAISERLTAHQTFALVRDVMDCMTEVIHRHGGFIINYAGDGIAAMWNAPEPDADHASDACTAAIEIQHQLPTELHKWTSVVGQPVRVGLGINTGDALIGNSGSKHRMKYSPLGHAVNLASRIEGATKYLGVSILITQATHDRIHGEFETRNLGEVSVIGIDASVRVHQLAVDPPVDRVHWPAYEYALRHYEQGDMIGAMELANQVMTEHPNDLPTSILIQRIQESDGVARSWTLPSK